MLVYNLSESPDLSLLIQNQGNGPLSVTISAPDFVQLEKTKVQLQEKEDSKVHLNSIIEYLKIWCKSFH